MRRFASIAFAAIAIAFFRATSRLASGTTGFAEANRLRGRRIMSTLLALACLSFTPAQAANLQSFISSIAPTGNPCTLTAPCRLMSEALANTGSGGTIICLDEGNFAEPLTISQSIIIDCTARKGRLGPYTIDGAGITVTVRGGTYNGLGATFGLSFVAGSTLMVENCVMDGVATGILVSTSTFSNLIVNDCIISNFGAAGAGVHLKPSGITRFVINRTVIQNNAQSVNSIGIFADGSAGGVPIGVVSNSFITPNPDIGIYVSGGALTSVSIDHSVIASNLTGVSADGRFAPVTVSLDHTRVTGNAVGVASLNGAAVILNNSVIQANNTAFNTQQSGAIFSYGNNAINGNQPGGIGSAPISIGLR
jgi:hypothetical protein